MRRELVLSVSPMGGSPVPMHVRRGRPPSQQRHAWREGRCAHCGMSDGWAGARLPCEATYAARRARIAAAAKAVAR